MGLGAEGGYTPPWLCLINGAIGFSFWARTQSFWARRAAASLSSPALGAWVVGIAFFTPSVLPPATLAKRNMLARS